jgi:hypothetical protein
MISSMKRNKIRTQETCSVQSSFVLIRNSISYPYTGTCIAENFVGAVTSFGKENIITPNPPSSTLTQQHLRGQGLLNIKDSRSHTAPKSVRLLWTSDRPDTVLYLTKHDTHKRQTFMPSSGFVPTIPASEQPQTRLLNRAATRRAGVLDMQHKLL